ncbi:hypothetical protein ACXD0S_001266 [Proteus mirabilis]|nr:MULTISPECIES: hypothetical protein [Proteus]AGS59376.1 hypothetical protein BB2000_0881 [Proteus mirabilis BB2000]MDC9730652.1 hypothetical protein [Proteus mirabilis]MDC9784436.1 hypothetical protein [Proteus mirabilis]MDL2140471.1 hypothetical protein [Proteus mirabilis]MDM3841517.1 hypothetical protein [Proteus mirabilis]
MADAYLADQTISCGVLSGVSQNLVLSEESSAEAMFNKNTK